MFSLSFCQHVLHLLSLLFLYRFWRFSFKTIILNTHLANGNMVTQSSFAFLIDINFDQNFITVWWLDLIFYSFGIDLHLFDNFICMANIAMQKSGFCKGEMFRKKQKWFHVTSTILGFMKMYSTLRKRFSVN